jgi:hypothetical protein
MRDVQSGPPLGPSRSKGSEACCRLSSGSSRRSKCPSPGFVRRGRAAGRRRSVPNGDSRPADVAESSRSTRARRGSVVVSVVMFGDLFGSKRRLKPSNMSDRRASSRICSQRHPAGSHSPGRSDSMDQLKHAPRFYESPVPASLIPQWFPSGLRRAVIHRGCHCCAVATAVCTSAGNSTSSIVRPRSRSARAPRAGMKVLPLLG